MTSTRQKKIEKLIQKELADIFQKDGLHIYGHLLTVTKANVTKDFSIARIYISIFKATEPEKIMELIRNNTKEIRFRLGQQVRNQLRIIPQLEFYLDDSLDYIEKIDQLLNS